MVEARPRNRGLVLTGGEVTLRKDLVSVIRFAKRLGYDPIQIQTNGRRFFQMSYCQALIQAGANEFSPSLHGSTASLHNQLTQSTSFVQTLGGIRNLVRLRQRLLINSVVTKINLDDIPRLIWLLHRVGVKQSQLAMVHPLGSAETYGRDIVPSLKKASPVLIEAVTLGRKLGINVVTEAMPPCLLGEVADAAIEPHIPRTEIVDGPVRLEDYTAYRLNEGKQKLKSCRHCLYDPVCEGPWKEYLEYEKEDFLKPILKGTVN